MKTKLNNLVAVVAFIALLAFVAAGCDSIIDSIEDEVKDQIADNYTDEQDEEAAQSATEEKMDEAVSVLEDEKSSAKTALTPLQEAEPDCEALDNCAGVDMCEVADFDDEGNGTKTYYAEPLPADCSIGESYAELNYTLKEFEYGYEVVVDGVLRDIDWFGKIKADAEDDTLGLPGVNFEFIDCYGTVNTETDMVEEFHFEGRFTDFSPKSDVVKVTADLTSSDPMVIEGTVTRDGGSAMSFTWQGGSFTWE